MNNKVGKGLYICFGVGLINALASMFLLGYAKGDHDRLKDLASKNDTLKF